jgi:hypothetical protein
MFNLVREICEAARIEHLSRYREGVENLPWDEAAGRLIVSKSHWPWDSYIAFFREYDAKGVVTVRDPRDSVVSLMQRRLEFQEALNQVVHSGWRIVVMERELGLPVFRFEDRFVGSTETFDKISRTLGVKLPETERAAILTKLTPEGVRTAVDTLKSMAERLGDAVWEHDLKALKGATVTPRVQRLIEAQWHRDHIGDGAIGKFRDNLTWEQEREILNRTQEYCKKFDYGSDVRRTLHVGDEAPAAATVGQEARDPSRDPQSSSAEGARLAAEEMNKLDIRAGASSIATPTADTSVGPATSAKTIGLCMIVKDEAHVILKCLESVRPLVDYVLVVDTGSTTGPSKSSGIIWPVRSCPAVSSRSPGRTSRTTAPSRCRNCVRRLTSTMP